MTPKQKAEELWWSYYSTIEHTLSEEYSPHESAIAKQCALIAVDEIIKSEPKLPMFFNHLNGDDNPSGTTWWILVKQEIEKL